MLVDRQAMQGSAPGQRTAASRPPADHTEKLEKTEGLRVPCGGRSQGRALCLSHQGAPPKKGDPGLADSPQFMASGLSLSCSCSHRLWPATPTPAEELEEQETDSALSCPVTAIFGRHQACWGQVFRQTSVISQFLSHAQTVFEIPHHREAGRPSKAAELLRRVLRSPPGWPPLHCLNFSLSDY